MNVELRSKYDKSLEDEFGRALFNPFSLSGKHHEKEVLELLTSKTITNDDIGKIVTLDNTVSDCNEWIISRINEDMSVDLFPRYILNNSMKFGDTNIYKDSNIRKWLNGEFLDGFSDDVRGALKVQSFPSNGDTLNDKVKCPSLNEVGLTDGKKLLYEGTIYPIFGNSLINGTNPLSKYTTTDGSEVDYWTRSRHTDYSDYGWRVGSDGSRGLDYFSYDYSGGVVA